MKRMNKAVPARPQLPKQRKKVSASRLRKGNKR